MHYKKIIFIFLALFCLSKQSFAQVDVSSYNKQISLNQWEFLFEFNIKKGWHIFAPYSQEFGLPLKIEWENSQDFQIIEVGYSAPQTYNLSGFVYDGYENKAFYKNTILTPKNWQSTKVNISWQSCAGDECIPQETSITLKPQISPEFEQKISQAEQTFIPQNNHNIFAIILAAFLGGLLLNFMPCVLPVLGLKAIALINSPTTNRYQEPIFYTLGVISSMIILSGILFLLKQTNPSLNWGFQMQNPWFISFMLLIFIYLTLISFNIIIPNFGWLNFLHKIRFTNPYLDAFFSGLLAVLIASPCTAPFMGAAVSYALLSPSYIFFPIFLCLGIGYALPFALLAAFPQQLQQILTRSKKYIPTIKLCLNIPLILTCLWLSWLLIIHIGWKLPNNSTSWQPYSPQKVEEALSKNQPVFINFTADWCLTCLVNYKTSLQSPTMSELVRSKNILLLKADATKMDETISLSLKKYNRASLPLYIYYDGKSLNYQTLPPILTPQILKKHLK